MRMLARWSSDSIHKNGRFVPRYTREASITGHTPLEQEEKERSKKKNESMEGVPPSIDSDIML